MKGVVARFIIKNATIVQMRPDTKTLYVVTNADLGTTFCSLRRRPMASLVLLTTPVRCSSKVSQVSNTIP